MKFSSVKVIAVGLATFAVMPAGAQERIQPNSQYFTVSEFYVPDSSGELEEYRAAGFAQPAATGVSPRFWLLPVMSIDPKALKFYDERGIPFTPSQYSDKVATSISVPIAYDASMPNARERAAIAAALQGETLERWATHWMAGPNVPFVHPPLAGNPAVGNFVFQAYQQMKPLYDKLEQFSKAYEGYQPHAATLNEVRVQLLVDGEVIASRDYSGSLVNFGNSMPSLTVTAPSLYQQNKIAAGDFEVNVSYRFLDAKTSIVEGRYNIRQVLKQFVEETQRAKTKSSSSGWQILGFGSRRSRLKTSLEQNFTSNTEIEQMEGTRVVTYDASEDMLARFEAAFFPTLSKQQLIERHMNAAERAQASGNDDLAKVHRDYAAAVANDDEMAEVDIDKAAAALSAQDYAGFIAHGMRFSNSSHQRTDNFRRVINTSAEIEQRREWLDYRTQTVQRETTVPVAIEAERKWRAAMGLCNAANMTVPFFRPYMPPQPQQVTTLTCVDPNGPLQKAGFQPGMWVIDFDGKQVANSSDIDNLLANYEPGDHINVRYIDVPNSNPMQTAVASQWVTLGKRP
ncbi:PDZ domain-containing protein [Pelagerythrobacter marensis]|uniref:Uncharacterized protein n=1 Tax=Pelagerythrobacter marensis TaxID=543877 RepID=A0A0G3XDI9_9SPHN|nr:PDZ domain-containing protein [Pelagerythrobacter marensis]AKM08654.1 hypothetical protein AM2010_2599 [Pelagerythrobacter marensis]